MSLLLVLGGSGDAASEALTQGDHYSSYLVAIWPPKVHTILVLGPFG